jgi:hypothetical protein
MDYVQEPSHGRGRENGIAHLSREANHPSQDPEIVEFVRKICAPLFEIFDFQEFGEDIYAATVIDFIKGRVS